MVGQELVWRSGGGSLGWWLVGVWRVVAEEVAGEGGIGGGAGGVAVDLVGRGGVEKEADEAGGGPGAEGGEEAQDQLAAAGGAGLRLDE